MSAAAAVAVFADARRRLRPRAAVLWGIATLLAVGFTVPVYLIVRPTRATAWGLGEILGLVLLFAFAAVPLASRVFGRGTSDGVVPLPAVVALAVLQNALFAGAAVYVVRIKYRLPLARVGLVVGRWSQRIRQGLVGGAAGLLGNGVGQHVTVYVLGLVMGRQAATQFVTREETRSPVYRLLPLLHHPGEVVLLAAVVAIVVPIGEELFFRGLVFGALRRAMPRPAAVIVSAALFAAAHLQPVEFLPIFILGTILAYLYDMTGSLVPGMIAHGINNLVALLTFTASGPGRP